MKIRISVIQRGTLRFYCGNRLVAALLEQRRRNLEEYPFPSRGTDLPPSYAIKSIIAIATSDPSGVHSRGDPRLRRWAPRCGAERAAARRRLDRRAAADFGRFGSWWSSSSALHQLTAPPSRSTRTRCDRASLARIGRRWWRRGSPRAARSSLGDRATSYDCTRRVQAARASETKPCARR